MPTMFESPGGTSVSPKRFGPNATTVPSCLSARQCDPPALAAVTPVRSGGGGCPMDPQIASKPSDLTATIKEGPDIVIATALESSGNTSMALPKPFPQAKTLPSAVMAALAEP